MNKGKATYEEGTVDNQSVITMQQVHPHNSLLSIRTEVRLPDSISTPSPERKRKPHDIATRTGRWCNINSSGRVAHIGCLRRGFPAEKNVVSIRDLTSLAHRQYTQMRLDRAKTQRHVFGYNISVKLITLLTRMLYN